MFAFLERDFLDNFNPAHLGSSLSELSKQQEVVQPPSNFLKEDIPVLPEIVSALLIAGNILVLIFAICGNIAAVIVCLRSTFSRQGTKFFLISLAISDLMLATFSIVVSLSRILTTYHTWSLGTFMCRVSDYIQTVAMMLNGCSLIAIAVDRYLAVFRGLKPPCLPPRWSVQCTSLFMALTWLLPIVIPLPMLYAYVVIPYWVWEPSEEGNVSDRVTRYMCLKKHPYGRKFTLAYYIVIGVLYLLLFIVLVFCYLSIIRFVNLNFRHHPREPRPTSKNKERTTASSSNAGSSPAIFTAPHRRHRRTAYMLVALVSLFFVCRGPQWIYLMVIHLKPTEKTTALVAMYILNLLSNVKCAISPFVYTIWNDSVKSPHVNNSSNRAKKACICFPTSSGDRQCPPVRLWRYYRRENPRAYDFRSNAKIQPCSGSVRNTQCFNISEKVELRPTSLGQNVTRADSLSGAGL